MIETSEEILIGSSSIKKSSINDIVEDVLTLLKKRNLTYGLSDYVLKETINELENRFLSEKLS